MKSWLAKYGSIILLIVCLILICGCLGTSSNSLPSNKYVAVEEYMFTNCTLIEGNLSWFMPHITLPVIFNYDGSVNGSNWADGSSWWKSGPGDYYYPTINDSFKVLYGTIYYRELDPYDTSTGLRVRGVYGFPYTFQSGFSIDSIDKNGTVFGSYNNTSIVLKVGDQWTTPAFTMTNRKTVTGPDQIPHSYLASFNTTWTISNLGTFDKANISRYNNSDTATGATVIYGNADPSL
jgi:hypothetical protein